MRKTVFKKTQISVNKSTQAQSLMDKLRVITETKEPITMDAPNITTDKKMGVMPAYDIRTDLWEISREAMQKGYSRDAREALKKQEVKESAEPSGAESAITASK